MKKLIVILCIGIAVFSIIKFKENNRSELSIESTRIIKDTLQFTILEVHATDKIKPSQKSSVFRIIEARKNNTILLDVVTTIRNISTEKIRISEWIDMKAELKQDTYILKEVALSSDGTRLNSETPTQLDPNEEAIVHYIKELPVDQLKQPVEILVKFGKRDYYITPSFPNLYLQPIQLKPSDIIRKEDQVEIKLLSLKTEDSILPADPNENCKICYEFIGPESKGNQLLVLKVQATNLSNVPLDPFFLMDVSMMNPKSNETTPSTMYVDVGGGFQQGLATDKKILPKERILIYYLFEHPKRESKNLSEIEINFMKTIYQIKPN